MKKVKVESLIAKLVANKKVVELVKMMQPSDVQAVITVDLGLHDDDAQSVVHDLVKHAEGLSGPAIDGDVSKKYPVPSVLRKPSDEIEESDNFTNNLGGIAPEMDPDQFPPPPRPEPGNWPYDAMNIAAMDIKNKGKKRGMMDAFTPPGEDPFNANLKKRLQPGGDYGGSQGIYSRNSSHFDNSQSSSGRSYDGKGRPGWSRTPPGKEFDMPIDDDDMPKADPITSPSPVGSPIPQFQGGHSQQRRMGFRRR